MPDKTHGDDRASIIKRNAAAVDTQIAAMAHRRLGDVVSIAEGNRWMIGMVPNQNAAEFLVSRLFTDAVFSQDIRAIQLIINRVDGGLPKDVDVASYRTLFGDCLNEIMGMSSADQMTVKPDDTVMMALCKSLYSIAVQDIYWDYDKQRKRRPTDSQKKERDAALRMVLERTGGRKTLTDASVVTEEIEVADWIASLPEST